MSTWFFGATSDWSQHIISQLPGKVESFGRQNNPLKNIQQVYYHPKLVGQTIKQLEEFDLPDTIIYNINVGPTSEIESDMGYVDSFEVFNKWWMDNRDQLFFKTCISKWLVEQGWTGNICYITSQISADHNPNWKHLHMYKNLRALDYEIIWNNRNNNINAYGICPASNAQPIKWADFIASKINEGTLGIEDSWLYGVMHNVSDKGDDQFKMISWRDYQK